MRIHPSSIPPRLRAGLGRSAAALLLLLTMTACGEETTTTTQTATDTTATDSTMASVGANTIMDLIQSDSRFSTLAAAVDSAGLVTTLQSPGPYTLFAPTNEAFNAAGRDELLRPENRGQLEDLLGYHIIEGDLPADSLQNTTTLTTIIAEDLPVSMSDSQLTVGSAGVLQSGIQASNGVIHVVNAVLRPPQLDAGAQAPTSQPTRRSP